MREDRQGIHEVERTIRVRERWLELVHLRSDPRQVRSDPVDASWIVVTPVDRRADGMRPVAQNAPTAASEIQNIAHGFEGTPHAVERIPQRFRDGEAASKEVRDLSCGRCEITQPCGWNRYAT